MRELAPGLWYWTAPHPDWSPGDEWDQVVGSVAYDAGNAVVLIDPLVEDWDALDRLVGSRPVAVLLTIEWHERSSAAVRERYAEASAPAGIEPHVIAGVGGEQETVYWLPRSQAIVTGDVLLGAEGGIRLCPESWVGEGRLEEVKGELRPLLDLPVEQVVVTHGEPLLAGGREALRTLLA